MLIIDEGSGTELGRAKPYIVRKTVVTAKFPSMHLDRCKSERQCWDGHHTLPIYFPVADSTHIVVNQGFMQEPNRILIPNLLAARTIHPGTRMLDFGSSHRHPTDTTLLRLRHLCIKRIKAGEPVVLPQCTPLPSVCKQSHVHVVLQDALHNLWRED